MSIDDATVSALMDAIDRYLDAHPHAADGPEGIKAWWLPPPLSQEPLAAIVTALERLEARGVVVKTALERGRTIYKRVREA